MPSGPQSSQPAPAASADYWSDCAATEPDRSISACTRIIDSDAAYIDPRGFPSILRFRDRGPWVVALQSYLASHGYDVGIIDGVYGAATQRALLALQKSQGSRGSLKEILVEAWRWKEIATAYYNRGLAYSNKGDHDRAIADYDQAIRFKPDYGYAYYGRAQRRQGKYEHGL